MKLTNKIRSAANNLIDGYLEKRLDSRIRQLLDRPETRTLGVPHPGDFGAERRAQRSNAPLAIATARISECLLTVPLEIRQIEVVDGQREETPADSHPAMEILQRPMPDHAKITMSDIKVGLVQSLIGTGNAYLLITKEGNEPSGLFPLQPDNVYVMPDKDGLVDHYEQDVQGKRVKLAAEDVIHIKRFDIESIQYGMSKVKAIYSEVMTDYYAKRWNLEDFRHGVTHSGFLTPTHDMTSEEMQELVKQYNEQRIAAGYHGVMAMPQALDFKQISQSRTDMGYHELLDFNQQTTLGLNGVPPMHAGILQFANYANSKTQTKLLWTDGAMPILFIIENALNHQFLWKYYDQDRGHILKFNLSNVEALQEDKKEKAQIDVLYVRGGIKTPNEVRVELGLEEIDGGESLRSPSGTSGEPQEPNPEQERAIQAMIKKGMDPDEASMNYKRWRKHDVSVTNYENGYIRILNQYFSRQLNRVLRNIKDETKGLLSPLFIYTKATKPEEIAPVFDMDSENKTLEVIIADYARRVIKESGQRTIEDLVVGVNFNMYDPEVLMIIDEFSNRSKYINQKTWEDIQNILKRNYEEGQTLENITKEIKGLYNQDYKKWRAKRIAQTELNGVVNEGGLEAHKQAGVDYVKWLCSYLPNSRKAHVHAHGQMIDISKGDKFVIGGEMMKCPGDPSASAGNVVNCHCTFCAADKNFLE